MSLSFGIGIIEKKKKQQQQLKSKHHSYTTVHTYCQTEKVWYCALCGQVF